MDTGWVLLIAAVMVCLAWWAWALRRGARSRWPGSAFSASQRADALLRQILGVEEFQLLMERGYLDVPSPSVAGRIYRIPSRPGRVGIIEGGVAVAKLCVVTSQFLPPSDIVLTHKLLIEGDEARYLRLANLFGTGRMGW
jgi:hypothetical protein